MRDAEPLFGYEGSDPVIDAAQLDVFNQGTFKTELCNKWEEIGTCPYGTRCQVKLHFRFVIFDS